MSKKLTNNSMDFFYAGSAILNIIFTMSTGSFNLIILSSLAFYSYFKAVKMN